MGLFGSYSYKPKDKNKKERWFLHVQQKNKVNLYYFSKDPASSLGSLPKGYEVFENERTGIPMLRKKLGKKKEQKKKEN